MDTQGVSPWHLWGSSQAGQIQTAAGANQVTQTQQVARIGYKRPDTWSFLFGFELTAGGSTPGNTNSLTAVFDLTLGVGRSNIKIPNFAQLLFQWDAVPPVGNNEPLSPAGVLWTASSTGLIVNNAVGAGALTRGAPFFDFPAQDIQCTARITLQNAGLLANNANFEVHAYFAPRSHIRPDWSEQHFSGELGGH